MRLKEKILIADDSEMNQMLLEEIDAIIKVDTEG